MNFAHLHLLVNHFPIAGLLFGTLFFLVGWLTHNMVVTRVGLVLLVFGGVVALATFFTGDPAEDVLKSLPTFSESLVHDHEEAAELAIWACVLNGVAAAFVLWWTIAKNSLQKYLFVILALTSVFSLIAIGRTNYLGGKISHPEIRNEQR